MFQQWYLYSCSSDKFAKVERNNKLNKSFTKSKAIKIVVLIFVHKLKIKIQLVGNVVLIV